MFSSSFLKATTSLALVLLCAPVFASTAATSRAVHNATANLPFRNPMLCIESRVDDLLSRMTIEEKAGQLFHTILFSGPNGTFASATAELNSTDFVIGTHRPVGLEEYESVGFSFNKPVVTGLLKETLGFKGVVLTDWGLITDTTVGGQPWIAKAWGVEEPSELERVARVLDAGCDQFGGDSRPELVVELVQRGFVEESKIDISVRKLLREKFILGLFDEPFVDVDAASSVVGNPYFRRLSLEAQRALHTLLTNRNNTLPLRALSTETAIYVEGFDKALLADRGFTVVATPEEADLAILRSLEYTAEEKERQAKIYDQVPTIVDINFNRPAAVPEVAEKAVALFVTYGSSTQALLDVVFNTDGAEPLGKLPFDLPRSDAAVETSSEDQPFDTPDPVFRFDHGLRYKPLPCRGCSSVL
ncbi:hypothetical protein S7711_08876 [Stachybotrys chartarum IBT 7711]|uniref:beta-glucosidase n=1 Tax=Stachybotrys chartarum (strain CBS 109288 / IBT 7711) TaxID=1280523 RepID=A0A084AQ17_STACB|nr:hypothetical protein S7711_08876 [Stachybotrys chartarum IBT 7711]